MSYLGRGTDKISNIEILDNITFDGSSSYSITKSSVAFTPNSAQSLLISIDGVVQAGNFTVSSSTIDFGVAVPSTSTCDFFLHYGVGLITTPSDGTVTTAKLANSSVSLAKLTATGTKDATTFLRGDNTFAEAGGGITEADEWRVTATISSISNGADYNIASNWERNDTDFDKIGTGMTESSGVFTFPSTGIYLINFNLNVYLQSQSTENHFKTMIFTTTDNSSYTKRTQSTVGILDTSTFDYAFGHTSLIFDVTNVSTHKVKFATYFDQRTGNVEGNTNSNRTSVQFIRLGDT